MVLVQLPAGATVIHQGAMPSSHDCMYLLASGEVDIVIAGGGHQSSANEDRMVSHLGTPMDTEEHPAAAGHCCASNCEP